MQGQTQVHIYKGSKKVAMVQRHRAKLIGHRAKDNGENAYQGHTGYDTKHKNPDAQGQRVKKSAE